MIPTTQHLVEVGEVQFLHGVQQQTKLEAHSLNHNLDRVSGFLSKHPTKQHPLQGDTSVSLLPCHGRLHRWPPSESAREAPTNRAYPATVGWPREANKTHETQCGDESIIAYRARALSRRRHMTASKASPSGSPSSFCALSERN